MEKEIIIAVTDNDKNNLGKMCFSIEQKKRQRKEEGEIKVKGLFVEVFSCLFDLNTVLFDKQRSETKEKRRDK